MRQGTVYVVHDDAAFCGKLVCTLESWGYTAIAHADAASFLVDADDDAPVCALVDADLRGSPGLAVIAALREARVDVPVILMTATPDVQACVRAMREGAIDFLPRPLREDDLLSAIRTAHLWSIEVQRARSEWRRAHERLASLTVREREVLALVLEGRRNKEIASTLDSREATVKVHRSRLMRKLGVRSVPELVQLSDCGNLAALVRRDRSMPVQAGADAPVTAGAARPSGAHDAWLTANGSWSGFTWTPRIAATRHTDA